MARPPSHVPTRKSAWPSKKAPGTGAPEDGVAYRRGHHQGRHTKKPGSTGTRLRRRKHPRVPASRDAWTMSSIRKSCGGHIRGSTRRSITSKNWLVDLPDGAPRSSSCRGGAPVPGRVGIPGLQDWLLTLNFSWAQELCIIMFVWMAKFGPLTACGPASTSASTS